MAAKKIALKISNLLIWMSFSLSAKLFAYTSFNETIAIAQKLQYQDPHQALFLLESTLAKSKEETLHDRFNAQFLIAQLQFKTGQYLAAESTIDQLIAEYQRHKDLAPWIALLAIQKKLHLQKLEGVEQLLASHSARYNHPEASQLKLWYLYIAGSVSVRKNDYDIALKRLMHALELAQSLGDVSVELGIYHQLVQLYYHMGNYDHALEYSNQMITIANDNDDAMTEAAALANKMNIYYMLANKQWHKVQNADPAIQAKEQQKLEHYRQQGAVLQQQVLTLARRVGAYRAEAWALVVQQNLRLNEDDFQGTVDLALKTIELAEKRNLEYEKAVSYNNMAIAYRYLNQHQQGIDALKNAEKFFTKTDNQQSLLWIYEDYAIAYQLNGQPEKALEYYQQYHKASLDLVKKTNSQEVLKLQEEFATKEKAQEIEHLHQKSVLAAERLETERLGRWLLTVILIATFAILLMQWHKRKKLNRLLQNEAAMRKKISELSQAKQRFFNNISHEFRTALTLSIGPLKQIQSANENLPAFEREAIECALENNLHMMTLLGDVVNIEQLDHAQLPQNATWLNLHSEINQCLHRFQLRLKDNCIQVDQLQLSKDYEVFFDRGHLEKIIANVLSNAVKFAYTNSCLRISSYLSDNFLTLSIEDQGAGISEAELPHIFERFYQGKSSESQSTPGTGVGLSLVKELMDAHQCLVNISSREEHGTRVNLAFPLTIARPINQQHLSKITSVPAQKSVAIESLVTQDASQASSSNFNNLAKDTHRQKPPLQNLSERDLPERDLPERDLLEQDLPKQDLFERNLLEKSHNSNNDQQQKVILVIDDHHKIRAYIKTILQDTYHIIEAENGAIGLELAEKMQPDLIISDIMMPEMNGFEMLKNLRSNKQLAHLSLILLTALGDKENIIAGLEQGADDYLTKPFDSDQLKAKVFSILNQKQRLSEALLQQFRSSSKLQAKDQSLVKHVSSQESERCKKLERLISQNLGQWEFDVEQMFTELNMTRSTLFRYTKRVYGCSPKSLLRKRRLETAYEMLQENNGTVSEVAYAVGFQSLSTFSRAFRERYQIPPTKIQKEVSATEI
ncbi:hybrid sensor histidine kinase/response regulator transcription factor [Pleionea litopenaei]|uniref:histidine kinase n=1 Tax=Pleionea litopenaei TaxID=3070815 RepID=A0AA51RX38_9GAMM|nr:response regulator [Pleionea sp. HL-JVS1]WMS89120.1 response regulator [Pleionea sp. HL-JVS1]